MNIQTFLRANIVFLVICLNHLSHGLAFQQYSHRKETILSHKWRCNYNTVHAHQRTRKSKGTGSKMLPMRACTTGESHACSAKTEEDDTEFQETMRRSVTLDKYDTSQQAILTIGSSLLQLVLQSPIWKYVLVPMARNKIIDTAQANGIPWNQCKDWLLSQNGPWNNSTEAHQLQLQQQLNDIPTWYQNAAYHAYETGHLSWNAAVELELASAAIGARNIPKAGADGENMFRSAFNKALKEAGSLRAPLTSHTDGSISRIVDIGCGTGTSTRLLGQIFSQWNNVQITGIDLSPYFVQTGVRLHELSLSQSINKETDTSGPWVCYIQPDRRIEYLQGDGTNLRHCVTDDTVDIVNIQFVFHELPVHVACDMIKEAHRMLKSNGGQLWISEMDFESPAYKAQRNNPFLFSLVRATEPFLDEYASGQSQIWKCLYDTFDTVTITAATGRHYAVVATKDDKTTKSRWNDFRFTQNDCYRVDDTHLQLWENKAKESFQNQR